MTETEWMASEDSMVMSNFLKRKATSRKFRLLAFVYCQHHHEFMSLPGAKELVEATERLAEERATLGDVSRAFDELDLSAASHDLVTARPAMLLGFCSDDAYVALSYTEAWATSDEPDDQRWCTAQIREIFGNPFRPIAFDPDWRTETALAIARGIYDERAFDRLPILADALQDAGCNNDAILNHLRDTTAPHVRGCWALDLVLGLS
jgi:hypothetical protein